MGVDLAGGQEMQRSRFDVLLAILIGEELAKCGDRDSRHWHVHAHGLQQQGVRHQSAKPAQQTDVRQQRSCEELLLREDQELPTLGCSECPAHGQFALHRGIGQFSGRFDFDQPLGPGLHHHQKIGHNVTCPLARSKRPFWLAIENSYGERVVAPGISDRAGLFLDGQHERTRRKNLGRSRFELPLAADRTAVPLAWNQYERSGRASSQAEGRDLRGIVDS